jgi:hypothetical protein
MYLRKPINQGTIQFVNKQVSDSLPLSRWEGGADKKHQPPLPARTRHVLQSQLLEAENSHKKHLFADFLTLSWCVSLHIACTVQVGPSQQLAAAQAQGLARTAPTLQYTTVGSRLPAGTAASHSQGMAPLMVSTHKHHQQQLPQLCKQTRGMFPSGKGREGVAAGGHSVRRARQKAGLHLLQRGRRMGRGSPSKGGGVVYVLLYRMTSMRHMRPSRTGLPVQSRTKLSN